MKNYIGISRDHSGSMGSIARAAARDYNANIESIRTAAAKSNIETLVSVVECGYGSTSRVRRDLVNESITSVRPIDERLYSASGSGTPLFDSVGDLIEQFEEVQRSLSTTVAPPVAVRGDNFDNLNKEGLRQACRDAGISYGKLTNDGMRAALRAKGGLANVSVPANTNDVSFLVMAVTDGQENASHRYNAASIARKIQELQATDRWTFVFRVPRGYKRQLTSYGIPEGNILEWDQTEQGVQIATAATHSGFDRYYEGRTRGLASTKGFYTTDASSLSKQTVKARLVDISAQVKFFEVTNADSGSQIRAFVEEKTRRPMRLGSAFYQLTKTEKEIQDYKQIAIRDKKAGSVFSGAEARSLLGLPYNGTVKVVPGNHGQYDIFVQSTSVNRKLVPGTQVMHWDQVGTA